MRSPTTAAAPPHRSTPWPQHSTAARTAQPQRPAAHTPEHPAAANRHGRAWPGHPRLPRRRPFSLPPWGRRAGWRVRNFYTETKRRATEGRRNRSGSTASGYTTLRPDAETGRSNGIFATGQDRSTVAARVLIPIRLESDTRSPPRRLGRRRPTIHVYPCCDRKDVDGAPSPAETGNVEPESRRQRGLV